MELNNEIKELLSKAETKEKAKEILKEHGVELSDKQIDDITNGVQNIAGQALSGAMGLLSKK